MRTVLLVLLLLTTTAFAEESKSRYYPLPEKKKVVRTTQEEIKKFYQSGYREGKTQKKVKSVGKIDGVYIFLTSDGKYVVRRER